MQDNSSISWDNMFNILNKEEINIIPNNKEIINYCQNNEMYNLSTLDMLEYMEHNNSYNNISDNKIVSNASDKGCYSCGGTLRIKSNIMICQDCGLEITGMFGTTIEDEMTSTQDSNVHNKGFIAMKIVGKGSYGYNRNLLKNCADYARYSKTKTLKELKHWNTQNSNLQLPKNVIEYATDLFANIKEYCVVRKDIKKGVQGACISIACDANDISRTPIEIAKIMNIPEKFLSIGYRIILDLNERGIITIHPKVNPTCNYIKRYFELLELPDKYKNFVLEMINHADEEHLHVQFDSKNNTRCIGTIYMLITRIPELRNKITKEHIEKECDISKTTFLKYYTMLCKYYKKFIHIFIKHKIPIKSEWKEDIIKAFKQIKEKKKKEISETMMKELLK